jgi:hypothetical protein
LNHKRHPQVVRQQSITLKDVLRGHQITIHEKRGSESLEKGHIIMARVVTLNEDTGQDHECL